MGASYDADGSRPRGGTHRASLLLAGELPFEVFHHARLAQRTDVSKLASLRDVAQQAPHDLAGARLGHVGGPDDPLRPRQLADALGHVLAQLLLERLVAVVVLAL